MIYYGYTDKSTHDNPKTLLQFKGDNILDELEKSLYNTLIQVPLHHFEQVYQTLKTYSNTVALYYFDDPENHCLINPTYMEISDLLVKVKSQIIGELKDEC